MTEARGNSSNKSIAFDSISIFDRLSLAVWSLKRKNWQFSKKKINQFNDDLCWNIVWIIWIIFKLTILMILIFKRSARSVFWLLFAVFLILLIFFFQLIFFFFMFAFVVGLLESAYAAAKFSIMSCCIIQLVWHILCSSVTRTRCLVIGKKKEKSEEKKTRWKQNRIKRSCWNW